MNISSCFSAKRWADMVDDDEQETRTSPTHFTTTYMAILLQTDGPPWRKRFFLPRDSTVHDLKKLVAARYGGNAGKLLLFKNSQELQDDEMLPESTKKKDGLFMAVRLETRTGSSMKRELDIAGFTSNYSTIFARFLHSMQWQPFFLRSDLRVRDLKNLIAACGMAPPGAILLIHGRRKLEENEALPSASTKETALRVAFATSN